MEDHTADIHPSDVPSLIVRLASTSPAPSAKDTRSFTYTVNPAQGPPSPTITTTSHPPYPSLPPSILSEEPTGEPSSTSVPIKSAPTSKPSSPANNHISVPSEPKPTLEKGPEDLIPSQPSTQSTSAKMGQYWSTDADEEQVAVKRQNTSPSTAVESLMAHVEPRLSETSAAEAGKKPAPGSLSRKNTTKSTKPVVVPTPDKRKPTNARTMTRIVTFFKKDGETPGDQPAETDALPKPQKTATAKSSKSTKSVKTKAPAPAGEGEAEVEALGATKTPSDPAVAVTENHEDARGDGDENESANDADDEIEEAAEAEQADEIAEAEDGEVRNAEIAAPVPVSASARNLVTILTEAVETLDDDVPLLGLADDTSRPGHHLVIRKARNLALPTVLLKVLVGRELAQPTKDALRVLSKGQPLALPGEDVEFVRTVV